VPWLSTALDYGVPRSSIVRAMGTLPARGSTFRSALRVRLRLVHAIAHSPAVRMHRSALTQNEMESVRSSTTSWSLELTTRHPRSVQ
jgi:hypothetical protein